MKAIISVLVTCRCNQALKVHTEINLDAFKHREWKTQLEVTKTIKKNVNVIYLEGQRLQV